MKTIDYKLLKRMRIYNEWHDRVIGIVNSLGYNVYCSLKAGKDSTFTFSYKGNRSGLGWDDIYSVITYILSKEHLCQECGEKLTDDDILFNENKCLLHR